MTSNRGGLRNQVGLCHFLNYEEEQSLDILRAVTGWDLTPEELVQTAHRGITLARLFNVREGFGREDDALPLRFHEDLPMHKGLTEEQIAEIVQAYYVEQGWDPETGVPTHATVEALGISDDAAGILL